MAMRTVFGGLVLIATVGAQALGCSEDDAATPPATGQGGASGAGGAGAAGKGAPGGAAGQGGQAGGGSAGQGGKGGAPACLYNSDCDALGQAYVCKSGQCALECKTDKDCPLGASCEHNRCVPAGIGGQAGASGQAGGPPGPGGSGGQAGSMPGGNAGEGGQGGNAAGQGGQSGGAAGAEGGSAGQAGGGAAGCVPSDDLNACTVDGCDPATGQPTHTLKPGCVPCQALADCPQAASCRAATCNAGVCGEKLAAAGAKCDDGQKCTVADLCNAAGQCKGQDAYVSDDDPCTTDSCDPATGEPVHVQVVDCKECALGTKDLDGNLLTGQGGCEYKCPVFPTKSSDPIDASFLDENCDGTDGIVEACVFVSVTFGDDGSGDGTRTFPFATIGKALAFAADNQMLGVCLSGEKYSECVPSPPAVPVYGRFDHKDPAFLFRRKASVSTQVCCGGAEGCQLLPDP